MKQEGLHFESHREPFVAFPAAESLSASETADSLWPQEIKNDPERILQAAVRADASDALSALYKAVPVATEDIETALANHKISEGEVIRLYESFTALFNGDPLNNRIALYIPFELLQQGTLSSPELRKVQTLFVEAYKTAWKSLLTEHDLREDFAEGDIIESEHRKESLPRVVKAAHLIPMLMERNIISFEEVLSYLESTPDSVLQQSVADALTVANSTGQLSKEQLDCMHHSTSRFVQNIEKLLRNDTVDINEKVSTQEPYALLKEAAEVWKNEEESLSTNLSMTENRKKWLLDQRIKYIAGVYGESLNHSISHGTLGLETLQNLVTNDRTLLNSLVVIHAVRSAIESLVHEEPETAQNIVTQFTLLLESFRTENNPQVQEEVVRTLYHFHSLGILTDQELIMRGFALPLLGAPASHIMYSIKKEVSAFTNVVKHIETHPELSKMLYPIVILLGSRTKGYASGEADLDTAVFVRPGVPEENRARLQQLTDEVLANAGAGKAMEFWLKESGNSLTIQDFENPDPQRGDSTLVHPLLGFWCGSEAATTELYQKMMPQYVYSKDKKILGEEARAMWLKALEHEVLQYRLLHKGYDRFNARLGKIQSPHNDMIDGASSFYDPGFRRLATKLYIDKVFLPQLSKKS